MPLLLEVIDVCWEVQHYEDINKSVCIHYKQIKDLPMASIVQLAIQKFKPIIQKQQEWAVSSQSHRTAGKRLERLAQSFLSTIVLAICSDEKLVMMNQTNLQAKVNEILIGLAQVRHFQFQQLKKIIGKFIEDQFNNSEDLRQIKQEVEIFYEENDDNQDLISETNNMSLDEATFHQMLENISRNQAHSDRFFDLNTFQQPEKRTLSGSDHEKKVVDYLMEISSPQTQLTYLCQSMGWKLKFQDQFASQSNSNFQVIVSVDFQFRKVKKTLVQKFTARQKKQGKTVASFKMLRRIYLSFPEIWDLYDEKRNKMALVVEKNPSIPIQLVPHEILKEKVDPIPTNYERDATFLQQKDVYLKNISSFKSQLNLLNQQNPGIFTFKFDKMRIQASNMWKVKGEMIANFRGSQKLFECVQQNLNSKVAEQQAARRLIEKVYDEYIDLFKKMSMIKNKKCIKT